MVDEYGLTLKQRRWCDAYIETGNATEAAKRAGYKNPEQSAIDNTRKPRCRAYLDAHLQKTHAKGAADADEVVLFLSRVMRGEVKDQFGLDASLQDRIKAGQELMKRYAVADQRQQGTLQRLDGLLLAFQTAIAEGPDTVTAGAIEGTEAPTD